MFDRFDPIFQSIRALALVGLCLGSLSLGSLSLSGCADLGRVTRLGPEDVDHDSPLADAVKHAEAMKTATPRLSDVPPPLGIKDSVADFRNPALVKSRVRETLLERQTLNHSVAAFSLTPDFTTSSLETENFAQGLRDPLADLRPPDPDQSEKTRAFIEDLQGQLSKVNDSPSVR